jgi:hypothetical protein
MPPQRLTSGQAVQHRRHPDLSFHLAMDVHVDDLGTLRVGADWWVPSSLPLVHLRGQQLLFASKVLVRTPICTRPSFAHLVSETA